MTISLGNAIKNIAEDEKWKKKILIGGCIYAVMQIAISFYNKLMLQGSDFNIASLVAIIISFITSLWVIGFTIASCNETINSDKFQMAELNKKNIMLVGLKTVFALLGWWFLNIIILTIVSLIYAVIAAIIGVIIFGILGLFIGFGNQFLSICIVIFSGFISILFILYYTQFVNTAFAFYFKRLKFSDLISFGKHFIVIMENKHTNWTLVGKEILFVLACLAILLALCISIIGIVLLPFYIFVAYFVAYNLIIQYAKEIEVEKYLQ